jgi:hypothetical protein
MSNGREKGIAPVGAVNFFPCSFSAPIVGPGGDPCRMICVPEGGWIHGENEGVCRCTDIPNHADIINESATRKKFCPSGADPF